MTIEVQSTPARTQTSASSESPQAQATTAGSQWLVRLLLILGLIVMIALAFLAATAALVVAIVLVPVVIVWAWIRRAFGRAPAVQGAQRRAAHGARFVDPFFEVGAAPGSGPSAPEPDDDDAADRRNVRVRR